MNCPNCGRYGAPDPETGYDADELCPDCKELERDAARDDAADSKREEMRDRLMDLQYREDDSDESPF